MSFSTYSNNEALLSGLAPMNIDDNIDADIEAAARDVLRDAARGHVAKHFAMAGGETAFWNLVVATADLTPALDAMMAYASLYTYFSKKALATGGRQDVLAMRYYDPMGQGTGRPHGLLAHAVESFAQVADDAFYRNDSSLTTRKSVSYSSTTATFTTSNLSDFTGMT